TADREHSLPYRRKVKRARAGYKHLVAATPLRAVGSTEPEASSPEVSTAPSPRILERANISSERRRRPRSYHLQFRENFFGNQFRSGQCCYFIGHSADADGDERFSFHDIEHD